MVKANNSNPLYAGGEYWVKYSEVSGSTQIGLYSTHTHSYGAWQTVTAATCTADGSQKRVCSCGDTQTETIPALGHDLTLTPAKAATATASGNNAYYTCSRCNKVFKADGVTETTVEAETIPALGDVNISVLTYEISDGEVTITDCDTSAAGALIIPAQIEGYPVTSIGENAFWNCSGLTSITIPSSVTSIGDYAFRSCSGLTSIEIPSSVTYIGDCAFEDCSKLTRVTFAERSQCRSIGDFAFDNCRGLTSIEIPSSVKSIGYFAFAYCSSLISITVDAKNSAYSNDAQEVLYNKDKTILICCPGGKTECEIPSSVKCVEDVAFWGCSSLISITVDAKNSAYSNDAQEVLYNKDKTILICCPGGKTECEIPSSVKSIGEGAFAYCCGLTSITIPSLVTSIRYDAFAYCSGLTSIEIPSSVTSIGDDAFAHCSGLTSITLPSSVTSIGDWAFTECSGLTSIEIPSSVTSIGEGAFAYCCGLTSITIPSSVTYIGDWAFEECSGLTSIILPSSVTSIGNYAFSGCSGLTTITIPSSVTSIGYEAFSGCSGLTSITIPSSVTSIGEYAFDWCSGLTSITILNPDCDIYDDKDTISDTATIYGYAGSTAETYATKYDRAFVALSQVHTHTPEEIPAVPATCVESGLTAGSRCSVCGEILVAQEVVAATGEHDYVKGALVAPTMEKDAYYVYTCSVCGESYEETVAPTGANITLLEQVQVGAEYKIAIGVPKVPTGTTAHWMVFTQNTYAEKTPVIETTVSAATTSRIFYSPGIPAPRMNDSLTARYYRITNGIKYVSNVTLDCSLVDYYNQKVAAGADARLIEALEAMLNYGSAAQIHFGYNTEEIDGDSHSGLVNRHIPQARRKSAVADFASIEAANAIVKAGNTAGKALTYYAMNAQVEQRINLALAYKRVNKSLDKSTLTFRGTYTDGTGEAQTVTVSGENFVTVGNYYTVYIDTIPAKDLRCMITGAIYDANDVQVSDTITTSLESYVVGVLGGSNENLKAVCLATLGYSDAIAAYVNK